MRLDDRVDVLAWANRSATDGPRFVRPLETSSLASTECPKRSGSRIVDLALGGLRPGGVTVVTCSDRLLRTAIAVDAARALNARPSRHVVIGSVGPDVDDLRELLVARERGQQRELVRTATPRSRRHERLGRVERYPMLVRQLRAECVDELGALDAIIVSDADAAGSVSGRVELTKWRDIAAARGVPVMLCVTGAAPGWDDPRDAHLDAFRTHAGSRFSRFIARGVAPSSKAGGRFLVTVSHSLGTMRMSAGTWASSKYREVPMRWAPEADFDGRHLARPTLLTPEDLAVRLDNPDWTPADATEAALVREVLVASLVMAALADLEPRRDPCVARVAARCGGSVAWYTAVLEAVQELPAEMARRVFSAGSHVVPIPELTDVLGGYTSIYG